MSTAHKPQIPVVGSLDLDLAHALDSNKAQSN